MFAIFPNILFLAPLSATLIRVALAIVLAASAWQHSKNRGLLLALPIVETATAAALAAGAWTQPMALVATILLIIQFFAPNLRILARSTLLISLVLCLSLLVTGAGAFAFDLPL